jgi:ABC-type polysaccharide/polyol phosphate export permease
VSGAPYATTIGGASLWVFNAPNRSAAEYRGVARFLDFLRSDKVMTEWAKSTGFLPATNSAFKAMQAEGFFTKNPGRDVPILSLIEGAKGDHTNGYRFGRSWFILTPILRISVYGLVFGLLLAERRPDDFLAFIAVGIFTFDFIQRIIQKGAASLDSGGNLIRSLSVPRALLPMSVVVRQFYAFRFEAAVMFAVVTVSTGSVAVGWLGFVLVVIPMASLFAFGAALLIAPAVLRFRDTLKVLPHVFRLAFLLSGALFPISLVADAHPLLRFLPLNPFYAFIELGRHMTIAPVPMADRLWVSAALWTVCSALIGLWFFRRDEHRYARG